MTRAACAGLAPLHDADVDSETPTDRKRRHERARSVCKGCRVLNLGRESAHREGAPMTVDQLHDVAARH